MWAAPLAGRSNMGGDSMKAFIRLLAAVVVCAMPVLLHLAAAQTAPAISPAISTPDKVETRIGTLDFKDGIPSKDTIAKIYDNLDFTHAFEAFVARPAALPHSG
jgi:hypothetical protein